jgi:hypothetical protein
MKKIFVIIVGITFSLTFFYWPAETRAVETIDGYQKLTFSSDKNTANADGIDKIRITSGVFYIHPTTSDPTYDNASVTNPIPACLDGNGHPGHTVNVSGSGNVLVGSDGATIAGYVLGEGVQGTFYKVSKYFDCDTGYVSFYISSTVPETKTISVTDCGKDGCDPIVSISVTFTAPTTTPTKPKSTAKAAAPVPSAKPTLALTATAKINTQNVSQTIKPTTTPPIIIPAQKLNYSGTTSANAKVTLTIHSDPITADVMADASGNWTYTLDPTALKLATGDHTVTAIATDTAGVKSDELTLASFKLNPDPAQIPKPAPYKFLAKDLLNTTNYIFGGIFILLVALLIFVDIKRRKSVVPQGLSDLN